MRRLTIVPVLLGLLACGSVRADSGDAALESYMLTMPNIRKMADALEGVAAAAKQNPAIRTKWDDDEAPSINTLIVRYESEPAVKKAFVEAGISVRDGVLTLAALARAAGDAYVLQQTGKAPAGSAAMAANAKLYQEHLAEIEPINERMRKLDASRDEGTDAEDKTAEDD